MAAPGDSLSLEARAKVNLALAVGPPEPEGPKRGWHPIASWMAPVSLADTLTVTRLPEGSLSRYAVRWAEDAPRTSVIDWSITRDLAVRAHLALEQRAGRPLPVQMRLDKRTPVGGGLGGGSSDAAAMLRAINELFDLKFEISDLRELARPLGSDVAYFLDDDALPRPALVEGFGDRIERTAPVAGSLVLLFPDFGCPTPRVYAAFDESIPDSTFETRAAAARALAEGADVRAELFNDLATPAEMVAPDLRELRAQVESLTSVPAHVTGSGSTLFLVGADADHGAWLLRTVQDAIPADRLAALDAELS